MSSPGRALEPDEEDNSGEKAAGDGQDVMQDKGVVQQVIDVHLQGPGGSETVAVGKKQEAKMTTANALQGARSAERGSMSNDDVTSECLAVVMRCIELDLRGRMAVIVALEHQAGSSKGCTDEIYVQGSDKLPIERRIVDGQEKCFVQLSQLLPVAIQNASTPTKSEQSAFSNCKLKTDVHG